MSEFEPDSREPLSEAQQAEMYLMVGRVATIYALLDQQPHVTTFNPEVTRRGLTGRLHSETLPDGRMVHVGLVTPSLADTLEAAEARHPTSDLSSTLHEQHHELWVFPKPPSRVAPENYRFYQGTEKTLPRIIEPRIVGRGLHPLNPLSGKRWDHLSDIISKLEKRVRG